MSGRLEGRVALVTGAGSGIGAEIAFSLAQEGARLVLCGRRLERLEHTGSGLPTECLCLACDVSDEEQVGAAVEATAERFGRLDILVNNAGLFDLRPLEETSAEFFDEVLAVNLRGAFLMSKASWPHLKASQGQIVNLSSVSGTKGFRNCSAYCASKFGLNGLSETLALEGKPHGIRVFCVCPGAVDTPLWEGPRRQGTQGPRDQGAEEQGEAKEIEGSRKAIAGEDERARMMGPEPVADLIHWLVTSDRRVEVAPVVIVNFKDPWSRE